MKELFQKTMLILSSVTFLSGCGSTEYPPYEPVAYSVPVAPQNKPYVAPIANEAPPINCIPDVLPNTSANKKVSWSSASVSGKYIALTFDDGPVAANTTKLLNMLKRRNIKATFYVLGPRVKRNPALMRRMVSEGHEVGNHTWTHGKLTAMSDSQVRTELSRTRDAIIQVTGVKPRTMRPPYGALSMRQRNWIFREYGYPTILWDVDPQDWKKPGASVIKNRILSQTKNGSIILLHDLHMSSVNAVPSTVDALLRKGYKFVTVSQLMAMSQ